MLLENQQSFIEYTKAKKNFRVEFYYQTNIFKIVSSAFMVLIFSCFLEADVLFPIIKINQEY